MNKDMAQPTERIRHKNLAYGTLVALAIVFFIGSFALQVQKNPLRLDEVDYFQCMQNTIKLGLPIYYAGEVDLDPNLLLHLSTRRLLDKEFDFYRFKPETGVLKETFFAITDTHSRYTYGMWHPPLYIYLGALFFRILPLTPDNSSLLRYFNLIFSIGIFAGMAALSQELYRSKSRWVFLVALVLYALNSLAVRGALLIDYNATLGPCVAIWFVLTYLWSERHRQLHWGLVLTTMLILFTSLGIAASLLLGVCIYWILFVRQRKSWKAPASTLLGIAFFFPVFLVFCRIFKLPFTQPFLHNMNRADIKLSPLWLVQQLTTALTYVRMYSEEIGTFLIILAEALFFRAVLSKKAFQPSARTFVPIVIIVGLFSQGSLRAEAYGFAKYVVFLLPLFFVYLAGEALDILHTSTRIWKTAIIAALLVAVLTSGLFSFKSLRQPGGTLYNKGELGIVAIAQALRAQSSSDEVVLSAKDVAFFAERRFVQWAGTDLTNVTFVRTVVESKHIQYLVANVDLLNSMPEALASYLKQTFVEKARSGSFALLKKKS